jgi:Family of unknown function (DUF6982)
MQNKIVIHYADGRILKGVTGDFAQDRPVFHVTEKDTNKAIEVTVSRLKAVFFVKDYKGNRAYHEQKNIERKGMGKKITVAFKDGETLVGYTTSYSPNRAHFFLYPSDPKSNNERVFVVTASTREIIFI